MSLLPKTDQRQKSASTILNSRSGLEGFFITGTPLGA
jgi:hypothetical protein